MIAWVRLPFLSAATNTSLHLYYGNAAAADQADVTGTWESRFRMVQHFEEAAAPFGDSTAGGNDGINYGAVPTADGWINGGIELNKTYINVDDPGDNLTNLTALADGFTVETWINAADNANACTIASAGMGTGSGWIIYRPTDKSILFQVKLEGLGGSSMWVRSTAVETGGWHYVAATYTPHPETVSITVDETTWSKTATGNYIGPPDGVAFQIGRRVNGGIPWDGRLDEFRISDVARSEVYRLTACRNQSEPDRFYTVEPSPAKHFSCRRRLTVSGDLSGEPLEDFPLLVSLHLDDLRDTAHGGFVAQSDGVDLLFTAADGTTRLDYEIEAYDAETGVLLAWVRLPTLAAVDDTDCYLYYGNPTCTDRANPAGVWRSRYKVVQHFEEKASPFNDSTANKNVGVGYGVKPVTVGKIDGCLAFDHTTADYVSINDPDNNLTNLTHLIDGYAVELWVNAASNSVAQVLASAPLGSGSQSGWLIFHDPATQTLTLQATTTNRPYTVRSAGGSVPTGGWHHVVASYEPNPDRVSITVDGVTVTTTTSSGGYLTPHTDGDAFALGRRSFATQFPFSGNIDEFRVSDIARSSGYAAASYANQNDPAAFLIVGHAQAFSHRGTILLVR